MNKVYLALGTNIEPRDVHLSEALNLLEADEAIVIKKRSSIYETAPAGYLDQADFLNMVIEIQTLLDPFALLDLCQAIEHKLGREREIRFGPRTIDLDILLYNQENIKEDRLMVPHPRMHERAFVLVPLAEIAADTVVPNIKKPVKDFLNALPSKEVKTVMKWSSDPTA
ncbi:2-amino-4-hydroxy-6-hydroxymethyldihydropteridine diphosphokinase [Ralstonia pickettii]|nr:2-amino-4-hydroxy-6-hydroxymethyldihydropteridine diphosphokinase [Ralstonia pickettii]